MAYLERARVGLREMAAAERAISDVRDLSRGELRIGMTPTFGDGALAAPLADFTQPAPAIRVTVATGPQTDLEQRLLDDDLDLALGFSGRHAAGVVTLMLYSEGLHVAIRADRDGPVGDADPHWFAEQRWALLPSSFATRTHVDRYFEQLGIPTRVTFEADSVTTLVQVVKRTTLTTVLPGHAIALEQGITGRGGWWR
ncbi:LysR substrate-binding domain-containing protein [Streptomyces olivaceus]|uniref:LysR substrate-binding domain-containing protein n=1 Tax=Streptomyces olivaceus TaxID=47716 RepID=UPI0036EA6DD8